MKRSKRRHRWKAVEALRIADKKALAKVRNNFMLSAESWGGYRCPSCGQGIRPHQLVDMSFIGPDICLDGCTANHPNCAEKPDWEERAWARAGRKHRYNLSKGIDDGWR